MGFVSTEKIYEAITNVQSEIASLKSDSLSLHAELLVEELSLSKAAKLAHTSTSVLLDAIKKGKLNAMAHPSGDMSKLRIKIADLLEWQEGRKVKFERGRAKSQHDMDVKAMFERIRKDVLEGKK
jgi:hypothetical protein